MENTNIELTILMPCLNEAETLEICIKKAVSFLKNQQIAGEVVIADNGSTDGSQAIAQRYQSQGVRVVPIPQKGYGSALIGGTKAARGKYVIMGDADDSYDFSALEPFVEKLREGYDLVMGNRFQGGIEQGAMPPLHRYLGNPVLSFLGRLFYKSKIGDFHCGLRGYNRERMLALQLSTTGMEYASEMVVKSELNDYRIAEVPTTLKKDGRSRPPHLRSWRDGWRHLRFLLIYSPKWLFLYPGIVLFLVGLVAMLILSFGSVQVQQINFSINTLLYSGGAMLLGLEAILFAVYTYVYASVTNFMPVKHSILEKIERFTVEKGIVVGLLLFLVGLGLAIYALVNWREVSFSNLNPVVVMRITIPSMILLVAGLQIVFASFFLGVLAIKRPEPVDAVQ